MADEDKVQDKVEDEGAKPDAEGQQTPEPEPEEEEEAHPLEPGGKRFEAVYRDMKDARREAQELRERLARVEGAVSQQQQPRQEQAQPAERFWTAEELQALVDKGQITPAKMMDQLAWQRAEATKREIQQQSRVDARVQSASSEVVRYLDKIPSLRDRSSKEFAQAARVAQEIADDLGRSVDDPIVQRRALREAFGSIEKLERAQNVREDARRNADTHADTAGGRGQQQDSNTKDPLRGVPQRYLDHWKRKGYTKAEMLEEAKYIRKRA